MDSQTTIIKVSRALAKVSQVLLAADLRAEATSKTKKTQMFYSEVAVLMRLYYRNCNQHRRAHYYRKLQKVWHLACCLWGP